MFTLILFEPEIPPNTGNIIRLCANTGTALHLVEPLGFNVDDKALRRAGLDYHEYARIQCHPNWADCRQTLGERRYFALTTKGSHCYAETSFKPGDVFVFGPESRGLPPEMLEQFPAEQRLRLPMRPDNRSLNLSNAAAVLIFEAWRQQGFAGGS